MAKLSPVYLDAQFISGIPADQAQIFTYAAGSTTPLTTYADEAGTIANPNPIRLDSRGEPPTPFWLTEGLSYKFVFTSANDSNPPTSPIRTIDNVTGVGDNSIVLSQWVDTGLSPTYIDPTTFTVSGDQTTDVHPNRRIKVNVTAGTYFGYIDTSVYDGVSLTTVTVSLDSGALDAGLSSFQLGLITYVDTSLPRIGTSFIEDDAITTDKIDNSAVTPDKLADAAFISILGESKNLIAKNNTATPNSQFDIDADEVILKTSAKRAYLANAVNVTIDITASGVNGLDTGVEAISTWYYAYVIYNPTTVTVAGLFSISPTSPTLPSGYTYSALVGAIYNNVSGDFIKYYQSDNEFWIGEVAVTTTVPPTSYTSLNLDTSVPPNAKSARISAQWSYGTSVSAVNYYAPSSADDLAQKDNISTGGSTAVTIGRDHKIPLITAQTIYYKRTGTAAAAGTLYCNGGSF